MQGLRRPLFSMTAHPHPANAPSRPTTTPRTAELACTESRRPSAAGPPLRLRALAALASSPPAVDRCSRKVGVFGQAEGR